MIIIIIFKNFITHVDDASYKKKHVRLIRSLVNMVKILFEICLDGNASVSTSYVFVLMKSFDVKTIRHWKAFSFPLFNQNSFTIYSKTISFIRIFHVYWVWVSTIYHYKRVPCRSSNRAFFFFLLYLTLSCFVSATTPT